MVELRNRVHLHSHFHYIRAIKDGSIKLVMNVDGRRKSKLKFRQLVDVYNEDNIEGDKSNPIIQHRVVRDLDNVSGVIEGSCLIGAELSIKPEPEDFNITLGKFRKQCKEKKRKLINCRKTETSSLYKVNEECLTLQTEDGGCDLEEPLSNWNTKVSKRRKKNQDRKTKRGSTSPSVKRVALPVFCDVKPEACEDDYSVSTAMDFISTDSLVECNKESESPSNTALGEEIMFDSSKDSRQALYSSPEQNSSGMVGIEDLITTKPGGEALADASEEFNDAKTTGCCLLKVKQEYLTLQTEDEECEIEEPLSTWNAKFSKRRKKNKERKTKCSSTSSTSVEKASLPVFCDVKPKAYEDNYSVSEAIDFIPFDPLLDCNKEPESPTNTQLLEEIMYGSSKDTRLVLYCSPEPSSSGTIAIEDLVTTKAVDQGFTDASRELSDAMRTQCSLADNTSLEIKEIGLHSSVSIEETEFKVPQNSKSEIISCFTISSNSNADSEEVKEDEGNNDAEPSLVMNRTGLEIVEINAPGILADYSGFPTSDDLPEATEDITKDDLPEATDIIQLTNCCNSLVNLFSVPDDSTTSTEEHQLPETLQEKPASSGNEEEQEEQEEDQKSLLPDEVTTHAVTDSIHQQKLHNQPEKLLSGRKALSPNSQAKLRKAMEHPDSPEKKSKKTKGKLYFSGQTSHRMLKAQGMMENIDRVEVIPNSKQSIKKASKQTQYQRATHKFPRRETQATKPQPFSSGCTSLTGCTQKAIDFSQGQIRDFHYVAAKLTEEIRSMTQITKRCLLHESNISESNFDEMKSLVKKAERTEESSKKWLSMIERDCTRFCKIMGMVREDSPDTENIVQKNKKIRFADDEGGDLCQVKVFENDLEYES